MPILVAVAGKFLNEIVVLVFWPGSIALMSLGAEPKPLSEVIYIWTIAIGLNVLLYTILGLITFYIMKLFKG